MEINLHVELKTFEELSSSESELVNQLAQVEASLISNPHDVDALQMKISLEEVLQLTRDLMELVPQTDVTVEATRFQDEVATAIESPGTSATRPENVIEIDRLGEAISHSVPNEPTFSKFDEQRLEHIRQDKSHCPKRKKLNYPASEDNRGLVSSRGNQGRKMHPSNKYADKEPDFKQLASEYPTLQPYVTVTGKERAQFQFKDFNATRELTRALLDRDFGIDWWIRDGQLCPPVPNRSNYIHWVNDLLQLASVDEKPIRGVDIGTGASCIYALLGAAIYGWHFVATDITSAALSGAAENIKRNPQLANQITLRMAKQPSTTNHKTATSIGPDPKAPVLVGVLEKDEKFSFCMCNPPFFEDMEESGANPNTACGGTAAEMVYPGGELAFIGRIVEDSVVLRDQIHWFTSMVGKKHHLKSLSAALRRRNVAIVRTTEFVQGKTSRWGLAWSFKPVPLVKSLTTHLSSRRSFTLQGIGKKSTAWHILHSLSTELQNRGVIIEINESAFTLKGMMLLDHEHEKHSSCAPERASSVNANDMRIGFKVEIFQQAPGAVTVNASLQQSHHANHHGTSSFCKLFVAIEEKMREMFEAKNVAE